MQIRYAELPNVLVDWLILPSPYPGGVAYRVGFGVIMMAVFWAVAPYSLVEVYQAMMMEAGSTPETGELLPDYTALKPRRHPSLGNR
jgi:hypothetical protein